MRLLCLANIWILITCLSAAEDFRPVASKDEIAFSCFLMIAHGNTLDVVDLEEGVYREAKELGVFSRHGMSEAEEMAKRIKEFEGVRLSDQTLRQIEGRIEIWLNELNSKKNIVERSGITMIGDPAQVSGKDWIWVDIKHEGKRVTLMGWDHDVASGIQEAMSLATVAEQ